MTVVSFSDVMKYQTCQRQFFYGFILGLSPIAERDSIDLGVKGHKLLQKFYELIRDGKSKEEAVEMVKALAGVDTNFNMLKAWVLVDNYIRDNDFTHETLHVEEQFKIPVSLLDSSSVLTTNMDWQIGFTPDLVFERKGGNVDVEDYKFVQRMWPQAKINRFPQLKLYRIFLNRLEYSTSRGVLRLFNITTGDIKYQIYTPSKIEEEILLRDFLKMAEQVRTFKELPAEEQKLASRTMNYFSCQYCSFEMPCSLEAQGKDASRTLASQYRARNYGYS